MIPKYSVKRPYTVLVAVVLVIVLGVVSLTRMTTDLLPPMNLPYVIVVTTDVGASPEEVEKDVTSPISVLPAALLPASALIPRSERSVLLHRKQPHQNNFLLLS